MNKPIGLLLVMMWLTLSLSTTAWSYPIADTLQYPLDSYVVGANHFGKYNLLRNNKWHLGDDCAAVAGTRVYAVGNGIVRHAKYHAPKYDANGLLVSRNYGGMYIIEHNVNGEKVCSLYTHLNFATFTKVVGQEVTKGEYLGQIGDSSQNGGWPEIHFHGGMRKGAYPVDPNAYVYGDWIFSGYTSNESVLNDWHDPSDFIASHQSPQVLPGQLQNGTTHQPILDCYNRFKNNGIDVGWPIDDGGGVFVHKWLPWNYDVQNFRNARGEESVIIYGHSLMTPVQAYRVSGNVWEFYRYGINLSGYAQFQTLISKP